MYRMAFEQTARWLDWGIYSPDQMSRMVEVELVSDLTYSILHGLSGKSQARLNKMYKDYDNEFPGAKALKVRFERVMSVIEANLGLRLRGTVFSTEVHFFTLFTFTYDLLYGLGTPLELGMAEAVPKQYAVRLLEVSRRFREWEVPADVLDAVTRASADTGRRLTRLRYLRQVVLGQIEE